MAFVKRHFQYPLPPKAPTSLAVTKSASILLPSPQKKTTTTNIQSQSSSQLTVPHEQSSNNSNNNNGNDNSDTSEKKEDSTSQNAPSNESTGNGNDNEQSQRSQPSQSNWSMLSNSNSSTSNDTNNSMNNNGNEEKKENIAKSQTTPQIQIPLNQIECIPFACQFHPSRMKNLARYYQVYNNFIYNKRNLSQPPTSLMTNVVSKLNININSPTNTSSKSPKTSRQKPRVPTPRAPRAPNSPNTGNSPKSQSQSQASLQLPNKKDTGSYNLSNIADSIIAESPSMTPTSGGIFDTTDSGGNTKINELGIDFDNPPSKLLTQTNLPPKREKMNLPKPHYFENDEIHDFDGTGGNHGNDIFSDGPSNENNHHSNNNTGHSSTTPSHGRKSSLTPIPLPGPPRQGGSITSDDNNANLSRKHSIRSNESLNSIEEINSTTIANIISNTGNNKNDNNNNNNNNSDVNSSISTTANGNKSTPPNHRIKSKTRAKPPKNKPSPKPKNGAPNVPPPPAPIPLSKSGNTAEKDKGKGENKKDDKEKARGGSINLNFESLFMSEKRINKNANLQKRSNTAWNLDENDKKKYHKRQASNDGAFRRYVRSFFGSKSSSLDTYKMGDSLKPKEEDKDNNNNKSESKDNNSNSNSNNSTNNTNTTAPVVSYWNSINDLFSFNSSAGTTNAKTTTATLGGTNGNGNNDKMVFKSEVATHPQHHMFSNDDWRCLSVVGFDACQDLFDVFVSHRHKYLQKYLTQHKYYHFLIESMNTNVTWDNEEHVSKLRKIWNSFVIHCPMYKEKYLEKDRNAETGKIEIFWPNGAHDLWKEIGFQGSDPTSDFRGMGVCALNCLVYFANKRPSHSEMIFSKIRNYENYYPLCASFVNIAALICELTKARQSEHTEEKYQTKLFKLMAQECEYKCEYDLINGTKRKDEMKNYQFNEAFYRIFCVLVRVFDDVWRSTKSFYFDFPKLYEAFKTRIEYFLDKEPISLTVLLEWIESDTYIHEYKIVNFDEMDTVDINLINTLKAHTKYSP